MTTNEKALKLHEELNGKLSTEAKCHVKTREDLSLAYTPGVALAGGVVRNITLTEENEFKLTPELLKEAINETNYAVYDADAGNSIGCDGPRGRCSGNGL